MVGRHDLSDARDGDLVLLVDDDDPPVFDDVIERLERARSRADGHIGVIAATGAWHLYHHLLDGVRLEKLFPAGEQDRYYFYPPEHLYD